MVVITKLTSYEQRKGIRYADNNLLVHMCCLDQPRPSTSIHRDNGRYLAICLCLDDLLHIKGFPV
jgi:hypothetical protein